MVRIWNRSTGQSKDVVPEINSVSQMCFSADEAQLLMSGNSGEMSQGRYSRRRIVIISVTGASVMQTIDGISDLRYLAETKLKCTSVCISRGGETEFVELESGHTLAVFPAALDYLTALTDGSAWAGTIGNHLQMITLEQE